ncbi:hypothetical protein ZYGM_003961 [Zygosaccharomyces mellis]|uniref:Uncharacterized protein n=1 Tax=Zygosaccharomyces mellis TaxID=42258 RepID=A0A4C2E3P6_9SACH|nr:hypothetical protein ZYGM_003961 [Zygosaccharomyces mellis]
MSSVDNDTRINKCVEDLIDIPELNLSNPPKTDESTILYQILDEAPHGRKLMNYMSYSRTPNDIYTYNKGPIQKKSLIINQKWLEEEKRAGTQVTPPTLQLETPVIFSWSKKAHDIKKEQITKSQNDSTLRESTNNRLYKTVAACLNHIRSREDWDAKYSIPGTVNDKNDSSPCKPEWVNSNFKVDPLQPFVAQIIKEPKKKEPRKEKTPSKMKNLFSFLSNSSKKERPQSPETKSTVQRNSLNQPQEIETLPDIIQQDKDHEQKQKKEIEEQQQDERHVGNKTQEQDSSSPSATLENTFTPTISSAPPKLSSTQTFSTDSPLSVDSFIPLQPKKKN